MAAEEAKERRNKYTTWGMYAGGALMVGGLAWLGYAYAKNKWPFAPKSEGKKQNPNIAELKSVGSWPANRPLVPGEWLSNEAKTAFAMISGNGALSLFTGAGPNDIKSNVFWTTGPFPSKTKDVGAFAMLDDEANLCVYAGSAEKKGDKLWCSESKRADAKSRGPLVMHVNAEPRLSIRDKAGSILWESPVVSDTVEANRPIVPGNWIQSGDHKFFMIQQDDGGFEIYQGNNPSVSNPTLIWTTNPDRTKAAKGDYFTILQGDGNLCTYPGKAPTAAGPPIWCAYSHKEGLTGLRMTLTNEGRLVIVDGTGSMIWASPIGGTARSGGGGGGGRPRSARPLSTRTSGAPSSSTLPPPPVASRAAPDTRSRAAAKGAAPTATPRILH